MPERRYLVRGKVQGVGFRWWARTLAQRLQITGTVRNCADGSVEIRASGSDDALAQLTRTLQEGPPGARVESVTEEPISGVPASGFDIVR